MLQPYLEKNKLEVGIDEAGRGCLFGPVCVAAVVWPPDLDDPLVEWIQDSKKLSETKRRTVYDFILTNAIAWSIQLVSSIEIDTCNILQATMKGMHRCIDDIRKQLDIDTLLIDGDKFKLYTNEELEPINHHCIVGGDSKYQSIAAASILAKTFRDDYILNLCDTRPELKHYDIHNNKGYGTLNHRNALQIRGPIDGHRFTFKPCHISTQN